MAAFYHKLLEKISILPGVASVGAASYLPSTGHNFDNAFTVEGQPPLPRGASQSALMRMVDPDYFQILGIPLQRGRIFRDQDRADSPPVVIISQSMARRYWLGADALGKRMTILWGENSQPREVVGIVGDVRSDINADPEPTMYLPYQQFPVRSMALTVKAFADPTAIVEEVQRALREFDPDELVSEVRTPGALLAESVGPWRFSMLLVGLFAALALVLATVGIFGVVSYSVARRTHEIGVRMALGARQGNVFKLILGQSSLLVLVGVGIGLIAALNLTRLISSLLYGVRPTDVPIFAASFFVVTTVALFVSYIPARRATKVDPMVALRHE